MFLLVVKSLDFEPFRLYFHQIADQSVNKAEKFEISQER